MHTIKYHFCGEVSEWSKEPVLKTEGRKARGFESHPLRQIKIGSKMKIEKASFFIIKLLKESIWRFTQVVEGDGLLNR